MVFRAIICCAALIFVLLAALSATAQSAGAPQPLNLMSFMQGSGKAGSAKAGTASAKTASTSKHRHGATKTASRPQRDATTTSAASSGPSAVAAASAYASQSDDNVQVVSGDEVNAIDLAMNSATPETSGAASRADGEARDRFKFADASQFLPNQGRLDSTTPAKENAAGTGDARIDEIARESWIYRFWSAVGDGFVALAGMVRQLFS
jgi:hypothetical protein